MEEREGFVLTDCCGGPGCDKRALGLDESETMVRNAFTDRL